MPIRMKEILLDKKSPLYLGRQFSYLALRSLDYHTLENLVKTGSTHGMTASFEAIVEATDFDHNAFISSIKRKGSRNHILHDNLSKGCRFLDVDCGTGTFIEKLLQVYPRSFFVGIEPSDAAYKATKMAAGKPVEILNQTGEKMTLDNEFHIVYLGESLYSISDKSIVISNCYRALKRGGTIAIVEDLLPEKTDEESKLITVMHLDFALQGYRFMTRKEVTVLLRSAGFENIVFTDFGGSLYLVTAGKV